MYIYSGVLSDTRRWKWAGVFTSHEPVRGSDHNAIKNLRVEPCWVRRCSKSHGKGRAGSGRVSRFSKIMERAGSP